MPPSPKRRRNDDAGEGSAAAAAVAAAPAAAAADDGGGHEEAPAGGGAGVNNVLDFSMDLGNHGPIAKDMVDTEAAVAAAPLAGGNDVAAATPAAAPAAIAAVPNDDGEDGNGEPNDGDQLETVRPIKDGTLGVIKFPPMKMFGEPLGAAAALFAHIAVDNEVSELAVELGELTSTREDRRVGAPRMPVSDDNRDAAIRAAAKNNLGAVEEALKGDLILANSYDGERIGQAKTAIFKKLRSFDIGVAFLQLAPFMVEEGPTNDANADDRTLLKEVRVLELKGSCLASTYCQLLKWLQHCPNLQTLVLSGNTAFNRTEDHVHYQRIKTEMHGRKKRVKIVVVPPVSQKVDSFIAGEPPKKYGGPGDVGTDEKVPKARAFGPQGWLQWSSSLPGADIWRAAPPAGADEPANGGNLELAHLRPDGPGGASADQANNRLFRFDYLREKLTEKSTGDLASIKVCVLDSGIDALHKELTGKIAEVRSFVDGELGCTDEDGHGTHCAGLVPKVAPNATLYIGKVTSATGTSPPQALVDGIAWAKECECDVISLSVGTADDTPELSKAVHEALAAGIVIVTAASNDGKLFSKNVMYPARYGGPICVGSHTHRGHPSAFSAVGREIDLLAPGNHIASLEPGGGSVVMNGTSASAPLIAGVVALVLGYDRKDGKRRIKNNAQVSPRMQCTARPPTTSKGTWPRHSLHPYTTMLRYGVAGAKLASPAVRQPWVPQ